MDYMNARYFADDHGLVLENGEHLTHSDDMLIGAGATPPTVKSRGYGNTVIIGTGADCAGANITISGNNSIVVIGAHATFRRGTVNLSGDGANFWLGALTTTAELIVGVAEGRKVVIGEEGMFSSRVMINTSDGHAIYDNGTGYRINPAHDVEIGRHVWMGRDVRVSKGATIGADSIIGQGALVVGNKCSEPNGLYAGAPAGPMRTGVSWSRMQAESWEEMERSARHQAYAEKRAALLARCPQPDESLR